MSLEDFATIVPLIVSTYSLKSFVNISSAKVCEGLGSHPVENYKVIVKYIVYPGTTPYLSFVD